MELLAPGQGRNVITLQYFINIHLTGLAQFPTMQQNSKNVIPLGMPFPTAFSAYGKNAA